MVNDLLILSPKRQYICICLVFVCLTKKSLTIEKYYSRVVQIGFVCKQRVYILVHFRLLMPVVYWVSRYYMNVHCHCCVHVQTVYITYTDSKVTVKILPCAFLSTTLLDICSIVLVFQKPTVLPCVERFQRQFRFACHSLA